MVSIPSIVLGFFLFIAMLTDLATYKVSNKQILLGLLFGMVVQVVQYQAWGILYFFVGAVVPILILFLLFLGNVLGAGDIKLFSVIGGSLGVDFGVRCIWFSFVAGAILGIFLLLFRKIGLARFHYLISYVKTCVLCRDIKLYCSVDARGKSAFHFTIAIFIGFLCLSIQQA